MMRPQAPQGYTFTSCRYVRLRTYPAGGLFRTRAEHGDETAAARLLHKLNGVHARHGTGEVHRLRVSKVRCS